MSEELYSKFDEALRAESMTAVHADRDRAAAAAVSSVRTHRRRRAAVASAVALVTIPALAFGAFALTSTEDAEPMVTPSPSPSITQSPSPSPKPSEVTPTPKTTIEAAPESWEDVPESDRPAYRTDLHADLPRARAMEDWIWQYVDDSWDLEARYSGQPGNLSAQSLFLFAPDGEVLHLFTLRIDVVVAIGHWDLDQRIAWLERHEGGDGFEVVQMDLREGTLTPNWAGEAAPERQRTDDGLLSVRHLGVSPGGNEVWATVSYFAPPYPVMLRDEERGFVESPAVPWLEQRWADGWGDRSGDPSAESWISDDLSLVVYEVLEVGMDDDGGWIRGDSRWLWHDIVTGSTMEVEPRLPDGQACWSRSGPSGEETGQMVGSRVVATCDQGTYLIDPKGESEPEPYTG